MPGCLPQWSPAAANTCRISCGETSPSSKAWFLTLEKNKPLQALQPGGSPPHSSGAEVTACSLWETQSHLNQLGLQRQRSEVGRSAPRSTSHIQHGCRAHTDAYHGVAGTWQLIKPPYRSCTLGQTMLGAIAERISVWARQAAPDTELLLLPFLDGDLHHSTERGFWATWVLPPPPSSPGQLWLRLCSPALLSSDRVRPEDKTWQTAA